MRNLLTTLVAFLCGSLIGCGTSPPFPDTVVKDVNRKIEFGVLQADPDVYKGQVIQLAGRIIGVEQLEKGTLLVVHQLPIVERPIHGPAESGARTGEFAVLFPGRMAPVDAAPGNRIIVVGTIQGAQETLREGTLKKGPYLVARCLHVWETAGEEIYDYLVKHGGEEGDSSQIQQTYCVKDVSGPKEEGRTLRTGVSS